MIVQIWRRQRQYWTLAALNFSTISGGVLVGAKTSSHDFGVVNRAPSRQMSMCSVSLAILAPVEARIRALPDPELIQKRAATKIGVNTAGYQVEKVGRGRMIRRAGHLRHLQ